MFQNVLAVVSDLVFRSKISEVFSGEVEFVRTESKLIEALNESVELLIIDLHTKDALKMVSLAREKHGSLMIVAYGSHVEKELLAAATQHGATQVVVRSNLVSKLLDFKPCANDF